MENNSSKAFTLIEIMISVALISVFSITMLNISQKNSRIYEFLNEKIETYLPASIVFNKELSHNTNAFASDIVSSKYDINNDNLRKFLKEKKYIVKREEPDENDYIFSLKRINIDGNNSKATIYSFQVLDIDAFLDFNETE
ncbi:MAG: Unknown protein [uncultured Campylobacterales bacterium]|uniref:Prepilin-type N-terminal cleavage/methylation domain-containing protein n=1 Tax=uncultured Campylobacterales bacterium TaxID=352960 RepID=A0A6S6T6B2_9BACT|nr:MAG: Unknown protein [uncultured Campylobacterales bacterium]